MTPHPHEPGRNIFSCAIEGVTGLIASSGQVPPLSAVADVIGVRTEELQIFFDSEAALVEAMCENAFLLLHHTFVEVVAQADPDDPVAQFVALADAYVEWGFRYPREFRIISLIPAAEFEAKPELMRYERAIHDLMTRILLRAMCGRAAHDEISSLVAVAHTFAYGVVSKMLLGDLARWSPGLSDREAARQALRLFIHRVLFPVHPSAPLKG